MSIFRMHLIALAALALAGCRNADAGVPASPPAPEISVAEVIAQPLNDWEEFTGHLEERERVEIRPRVAGYVDSVHFADGARVQRGQLLFNIDPRPFDADVERWSGEVERASSQHELAQLNQKRARYLLAERVIAAEEADRLEADERSTRAALKASTASLAQARLSREFTEVRSPIEGRASRALIRPGNLVTSASLLTTVVSEGSLLAYFDVDERTYLQLLHATRESSGEVPRLLLGLANESGYSRAGRLDFIDNGVDARTGMITLRGAFDNQDGTLAPGLFTRIQLVLPISHESVLIEERAVGTDLGKRFVLVLRPDDTLEYRAVTLGPAVGGLRRVKQGLAAGDVIVVNGQQRVRPGMKVSPKRVAMNAGGPELQQLAAARPEAVALREQAAVEAAAQGHGR